MQRWNGWGVTNRTYHLPLAACTYLKELLGAGVNSPNADFQTSLNAVPTSRLPDHSQFSTDNEARLGLTLPLGGWPLIDRVRTGAQPELGWDNDRWTREQDAYARLWNDSYRPPSSPGIALPPQ